MDVVKILQQRRYKRFEEAADEPQHWNTPVSETIREAERVEIPSYKMPPVEEERKFVTAGPQPNVQVVQITESLPTQDATHRPLKLPAPSSPVRSPVRRTQLQMPAKPDPAVAELERRLLDLEARLAMVNQRNADMLRHLAEREAQWGHDRLRLVTELEEQKTLISNREIDLRVAKNAERRAKDVLRLKQSELDEAEGKLSTYARMYGHTSMERMAKLSARVAELEEALAQAKAQGSPERANGSESQVTSLRQQLRMATKDKARLLQQNRSLSAKVVASPSGSLDLDPDGSQASSSQPGSSRGSPPAGSPEAVSRRTSRDGTAERRDVSIGHEALAGSVASHPLVVDGTSSPASDADGEKDPSGEAAGLRARIAELEHETGNLRVQLREAQRGRKDAGGSRSPEYPSILTSFKLASSDALRERLHAQIAENRLKGGRASGDLVSSKGSADAQRPGSPSSDSGAVSLQATLEGLDRAVKEATQGESLQHRVATLEASNAALHADLARAVDALEAAAKKESRDYEAIQSLRRQLLEAGEDNNALSWPALAASSGGPTPAATPDLLSPPHRIDSDVERLARDLDTSNAAMKELNAQFEAEIELRNQKAEIQEQLLEEERGRRRRLEQDHEDLLHQLEAARAELAVLRDPVQARATELGSLREVNMRLSRQLEEALRSLHSRERLSKGGQETEEDTEERELEMERLKREQREAVREAEEVRSQRDAMGQRLQLLQEELDVLHTAKSALHAQVESSSKLREQHLGASSAQVEALKADLEKVSAELTEAQSQIRSLRKARLDEAQTAAAQLRAVKMEARKREDELLSANPSSLRSASPVPPFTSSPATVSPSLQRSLGQSHGIQQTDAEALPHLRHVAGDSASQGGEEIPLGHVSHMDGEDGLGDLPELLPLGNVRRTVSEPEHWSRQVPAEPNTGSPSHSRIFINQKAGEDNGLEAQLLAARCTISSLQNEVRAKRGQLESASAREAVLREGLLQRTAEAKKKGAELEATSQDLQTLRVKHNDVVAEFAAFKKGLEEGGASAWHVQQLQARLAREEEAHAQARELLPALRKAAEEATAALAAAHEDADLQRREARTAAIKAEERGVEIEGLRAEVRRTEARLRATQANLAAQQDKAELQARMTRQYVEEFERERALRTNLQAHLPQACKQALLLKQQLQDLSPQLPSLEEAVGVAKSLERVLSSMSSQGEEPRQAGGRGASEDADRMGGVTQVSVQSVLLLEAHRRSAEAEAIKNLLTRSREFPQGDQGSTEDAGDVDMDKSPEASPSRLKVDLDRTRQKAVDLLRERVRLEQCVRYLAVRAGLAHAVGRNGAGLTRSPLAPLDDLLGENEVGASVEGSLPESNGSGQEAPLGLVLSKELKDLRSRGRDASLENGTAPQVEQGILSKVAALCAASSTSTPSPWKRSRQAGEGGEEGGKGGSPCGSPALTPRGDALHPSILVPSPLSRYSKGIP
eukprot:jgi/Botrbrau1/11871/Bobra.126_2s0006.1